MELKYEEDFEEEDEYMEDFEEEGIDEKKERLLLDALITALHDNTSQWAPKGNTPNESFRREKKLPEPFPKETFRAEQENEKINTPVKRTKVGRNDPCPCGSGKKYKNCCGK